MTQFALNIDMDNAAFDGAEELPRLLGAVAERLTEGRFSAPSRVGTILDSNGNTVGRWQIREEVLADG